MSEKVQRGYDPAKAPLSAELRAEDRGFYSGRELLRIVQDLYGPMSAAMVGGAMNELDERKAASKPTDFGEYQALADLKQPPLPAVQHIS